jgi:hypothetical protein
MNHSEHHKHGTGSPIVDQFSIVQGGPIYRFQVRVGMALPDWRRVLHRTLILVAITWLPLLILSAIQGLALGDRVKIPFLRDYLASVRFLITLPILVAAEIVIDPKLRQAVKHFVHSHLVVPSELPAFEEVIRKTESLRDSWWPSSLLIAAAILPCVLQKGQDIIGAGVSSWHFDPLASDPTLSYAGWWFAVISLSIYRLWLFRWIWFVILWTIFLWRVSKVNLDCYPIHPDYAAGLGFLAETQIVFGLITLSGSSVVAAGFANEILYEGTELPALKIVIIAFCLFEILLVSAPLLVLTPKLLKIKKKGLHQYGTLGTVYARSFHSKWIGSTDEQQQEILAVPDSSSLANYSNDYKIVREMKVLLVNKETLIGLAIPAVLPMIVLTAIFAPSAELFKALLKLLA